MNQLEDDQVFGILELSPTLKYILITLQELIVGINLHLRYFGNDFM